MIVNENETLAHPDLPNHFIQFGVSTWTQDLPASDQTQSVRRAVYNPDGVFSPRGSSEFPLEDMGLLIRACLQRDKIDVEEITLILNEISASLRRQSQR